MLVIIFYEIQLDFAGAVLLLLLLKQTEFKEPNEKGAINAAKAAPRPAVNLLKYECD